MNDKSIFIYGLVDPRDNSIRYVGKTINPKKRYREHLNERKSTKKANWIRKLIGLGLKPRIIFLQIFHDDTLWEELERKWVSICRQKCDKLTNGTSGGDGVHNPNPESIYCQLESRKKRFSDPDYRKWFKEICNLPERRRKLSEALKGTIRGPHTKEWHDVVSKKTSGKNNPMYHKGFYKVWVEKYGQEKADEMLAELGEKHSKINSGSGNPMSGKYMYDIWVEKYGKEVSDQKMLEVNKKRSDTMKKFRAEQRKEEIK